MRGAGPQLEQFPRLHSFCSPNLCSVWKLVYCLLRQQQHSVHDSIPRANMYCLYCHWRPVPQVYRVMALAVLLNRTLVLPKMQCFCYKNWFMLEQCRCGGGFL